MYVVFVMKTVSGPVENIKIKYHRDDYCTHKKDAVNLDSQEGLK